MHTNILAQMICHAYMTEYDFEAHLDFLRSLYRKKAALMVELVEQHLCPAGITYQDFEGGLFVWGTLPDGVDMPEFCTRAVRDHKVAVVPGSAFFAGGGRAVPVVPHELLHACGRCAPRRPAAAGRVCKGIHWPLSASIQREGRYINVPALLLFSICFFGPSCKRAGLRRPLA